MLAQWIRIFYSNGSSLTDYSIAAQNSDDIPFAITASTDYLYVGQYYPFNNAYFELKVANTNASLSSVQYWSGKVWADARDVIDGTNVAGKSLSRSGVIQWSPDKSYSWNNVEDTFNQQGPTQLATLKIYDLYWMRFKWSGNLSGTTALKSVTYNFSNDELLRMIDAEVDNYKVAFGGASKLDWNNETMLASQHVIADLKTKGFILGAGNILRFDDVALATSYKALAIIYAQLGEPFRQRYLDLMANYSDMINVKRFTIDTNTNGMVDKQEISSSVAGLIR